MLYVLEPVGDENRKYNVTIAALFSLNFPAYVCLHFSKHSQQAKC